MSDLKERLRAWADTGDMGRGPDPSDMRREAADRIEVLERALSACWALMETDNSYDGFECKELARQALEQKP